ncbi:formate dehydrogenase accessory sulfurtransferase FdhD [Bosea massiliensis]|uniref:Sulfur carrier protein FdhD n=1 Tax=Bosea massiliensis TaxID=151419 RepID=A0ABW0PC10_9HYPH
MIHSDPIRDRHRVSWRNGVLRHDLRTVATETAVALSYNGSTHAVMMATPLDLTDFAIGFSLNEGLIADMGDIRSIELQQDAKGIDLQIWLVEERSELVRSRRRAMVGPAGCGLCGVESLAAAAPTLPNVCVDGRVAAEDLMTAMDELGSLQILNQRTRAVHAAAWWQPIGGLRAIREDVGRHNALDKLAGAFVRQKNTTAFGVLLLTSRISVELVQKAAMMGAPVIAAVSAPTSLAIEAAQEAGITMVATARADGFDVFCNPQRIVF